jgi:hypothetical protein
MDTYRPNENVTVVVDGTRMRGTVTRVDRTDVTADGPLISVHVGDGVGPVRRRATEVSHVSRWG